MMYQNKIVACLKVNGKVLREDKEFVSLPFGSEYSILIKNLNSVRVQVKVDIDGSDATGWIIINPNSEVELERFVKNLDKGNRFKFIERTTEVENHRGVKSDDGIVRVEYAFEKLKPVVNETHTYHYDHYDPYYPRRRRWNDYWPYSGPCWRGNTVQGSLGNVQRSLGLNENSLGQASGQVSYTSSSGAVNCSNVQTQSSNDVGITVPGSESTQKFVTVAGFETQQSEVLIIRLRGVVAEKKVDTPVTVNDKKTCQSCGKKSEYKAEFCSACGTALNVI